MGRSEAFGWGVCFFIGVWVVRVRIFEFVIVCYSIFRYMVALPVFHLVPCEFVGAF